MLEQFAHLGTAEGLISLITLVVMEIVLGIDNIIFISILAGKLPKHQQAQARKVGLTLALLILIGLFIRHQLDCWFKNRYHHRCWSWLQRQRPGITCWWTLSYCKKYV